MDQDQLKTLLQRYHDGTATTAEKNLLAAWYRDLSKTEADFFRNEQEEHIELQFLWKQIENKLDTTPAEPVPVVRTIPVKAILKWAAAAAIAGLIAMGWLWHLSSNRSSGSNPGAISRVEQPVTEAPEQWVLQHNNTKQEMKIELVDGSVVKLAPAGKLKYKASFPGAKRDLYLEGTAFFEVAKDKTKPFTVYAGGLSTTALGTSFWVRETREGCNVKLLTGKVVINTTIAALKGWNRSVYLVPGEELRLDTFSHTVAVNRSQQKPVPDAGHLVNSSDLANEMMFDHTPLTKVFEKLQAHYHQAIEYDPASIKGIHFTGAVLKSDSMSVILKAIGQMNNLTITPGNKGFVVRKNPQ